MPSRVERWEERTEWPLAGVAVAFLAAYAWPILDPALLPVWRDLCQGVNRAAWVVFALDYVIRIGLAGDRWHYWSRHLLDLLIVALPVLRPLRLLRLLMLLRILNRQATESLRGRVAVYVGGAAFLLIFCAALAALDAERRARGGNIDTFGDAVWWAITTVSTVGYGDHYPVTFQGRAVAVGLMLGGVALIGVVTASLASWLLERVRAVEDESSATTAADLQRVLAEVQLLRAEIRVLHDDEERRAAIRAR